MQVRNRRRKGSHSAKLTHSISHPESQIWSIQNQQQRLNRPADDQSSRTGRDLTALPLAPSCSFLCSTSTALRDHSKTWIQIETVQNCPLCMNDWLGTDAYSAWSFVYRLSWRSHETSTKHGFSQVTSIMCSSVANVAVQHWHWQVRHPLSQVHTL